MVKPPREENGPDGYPKDNPEFDRRKKKVLEEAKEMAEQARRFLKKLAEVLRNENNNR